jgi:hypothetical protein
MIGFILPGIILKMDRETASAQQVHRKTVQLVM